MTELSYDKHTSCHVHEDCEHSHDHHNCVEAVARAKGDMPGEDVLIDLSELFKVFGDSTRIRILFSLFDGEMCVNDVAEVLSYGQSAVSHQLRILKNAGLVKSRRDGKQILYSLADEHVRMIINQGMDHVLE